MHTRTWTRHLLLGPDDGWGATMGTGPTGIALLSTLAVTFQVLDLATGLRMMLRYGIGLEQNPLARTIMQTWGPLGLIDLKLSVVLGGVLFLRYMARAGRPRLARNCLAMTVGLGLLGFASNLVG
ncbi:MAG: hypothetical protein NVSMB2_22120 [Chloroflexota bacterium]